MNSIEEYALALVVNGAESTVEDDMNENGDLSDSDHDTALGLAMSIIRGIGANPDEVLAMAIHSHKGKA